MITPSSISNQPDASEDALIANEPGTHDMPVVLLELRDELARSRMREAFWISVIAHIVLIFAIATAPPYLDRIFAKPAHVMTAAEMLKQDQATYLALPPDLQKITKPPNTDVISDKNRIASSRNPAVNRDELRKILDSARQGPPSAAGRPQPPMPAQPQQQQQQMAQAQQPPQGGQQAQERGNTQLQPSQNSQFQNLRPGGGAGAGSPFSSAMSAGSAIEQAARATAGARGVGGGPSGDYGLGTGRQGGSVHSQLDILSDTRGVDFGPYLERILHTVRINWYNLIPEVARPPLMKKGKVSIEFAILKNGQVAGMRLTGQSGDVSLDRAAWGGITASNPFPPLPSEFTGEYLALRFHFYYNPETNELQ